MREGAGREAAGEIVVGVDGGLGSWEALSWAAAEASVLGLGLRIVHVVEWPCLADAWPDSAVDRLASLSGAGAQIVAQGVQRVAEIAPNVSVTTLVDVGDVAWLLLRAASGATMLVVGKRRGTRPWWMRGHRRTSVAVARRASCPVAVVELTDRPGGPLSGWVVVVDDVAARGEAAVMRYARGAARRRGVGVAVVPAAGRTVTGQRGAALVVLAIGRTGRHRFATSRAVARAVAAATEPTVLVPT